MPIPRTAPALHGEGVRDDGTVDSACIGLENDGLTLFDVRRSDGEIWWCSARLRVPGLVAEKTHVAGHYAVTFNDLIDFFKALSADWRGWQGERSYDSLEGDLRLTATHDGRHVRLAVTLRQSAVADGWSASAVLSVDPGEQLSAIASDVEALLSTG